MYASYTRLLERLLAATTLYSKNYRGYQNGKCFDLSAAVTFTNIGTYPEGAIEEFTKQDRRRVTAQLMLIVDSFRSLR